ncbi:hypothetical protein LCGC14_1147910, partial [marine sediment metagenome]
LAEAIDALIAEQATAADVRRQLRDMQNEILARLTVLEGATSSARSEACRAHPPKQQRGD